MYYDDGILPQDLSTAVFYDPCRSASTADREQESSPGSPPPTESPDTPSTDEPVAASSTVTGLVCEVSSSRGIRGSVTDVYRL